LTHLNTARQNKDIRIRLLIFYDFMQLSNITCTYFVSATVSAIIYNKTGIDSHSKYT
jgi:hypothetical protein